MGGNQIFEYPDTIGGCRFEIYGTKGRASSVGTIAQKESGTAEIVREENGVVTYEEIKYISGDIYTKEIEKFKQSVLEKTNLP